MTTSSPFEIKISNYLSIYFDDNIVLYECVLTSPQSLIKHYLRYSDFLRVHQSAQKQWTASSSGLNFPAFPPKKRFTLNKKIPEFLQQRVSSLNQWLSEMQRYMSEESKKRAPLRRQVVDELFGKTIALELIKNGDFESVSYFELRGDELLSIEDDVNGTMMHYGVASHSLEAMEWLLKQITQNADSKPDPTNTVDYLMKQRKDDFGWTALSLAKFLQKKIPGNFCHDLEALINNFQTASTSPAEAKTPEENVSVTETTSNANNTNANANENIATNADTNAN
ncbi:PX domain containing protein, partial [Reticulomyxa filosa]